MAMTSVTRAGFGSFAHAIFALATIISGGRTGCSKRRTRWISRSCSTTKARQHGLRRDQPGGGRSERRGPEDPAKLVAYEYRASSSVFLRSEERRGGKGG